MKDEKILKDELMNEEELDQVAGGYNIEGVLNALQNMSTNLVETINSSAGKKPEDMMMLSAGGKTSNS